MRSWIAIERTSRARIRLRVRRRDLREPTPTHRHARFGAVGDRARVRPMACRDVVYAAGRGWRCRPRARGIERVDRRARKCYRKAARASADAMRDVRSSPSMRRVTNAEMRARRSAELERLRRLRICGRSCSSEGPDLAADGFGRRTSASAGRDQSRIDAVASRWCARPQSGRVANAARRLTCRCS